MKISRILVVIVMLFSGSPLAHAQDAYFGLGASVVHTDISTIGSNEKSFSMKLFAGLQPKNGIGLELGAFIFKDLERDAERDSDGEFKLSFSRQDLYLGPTFRIQPKRFVTLNAKLGVTYSQIEMTVKESFYGLKPAGEAKVDDEVMGYFLSLGFEPYSSHGLSTLIMVDLIHRPKVFSDSDRRFDMNELGMSVSLVF